MPWSRTTNEPLLALLLIVTLSLWAPLPPPRLLPPRGQRSPQSDNVTINRQRQQWLVRGPVHGIAEYGPGLQPGRWPPDYSASAFVAFSLTASATDAEGDDIHWSIGSVPSLPVARPSTGTAAR